MENYLGRIVDERVSISWGLVDDKFRESKGLRIERSWLDSCYLLPSRTVR